MRAALSLTRRQGRGAVTLATALALAVGSSGSFHAAGAQAPARQGTIGVAVTEVTPSEVVLALDVPGAVGRDAASATITWNGFEPYSSHLVPHEHVMPIDCVEGVDCTAELRVPRNGFVAGEVPVTVTVTDVDTSASPRVGQVGVSAEPPRPRAWMGATATPENLFSDWLFGVRWTGSPAGAPETLPANFRTVVTETRHGDVVARRTLWSVDAQESVGQGQSVRPAKLLLEGTHATVHGIVTDRNGIESAATARTTWGPTAQVQSDGEWPGVITRADGESLTNFPRAAVGDPLRGARLPVKVTLPPEFVSSDSLVRLEVLTDDGSVVGRHRLAGTTATLNVMLPGHRDGGSRSATLRVFTSNGGAVRQKVDYHLDRKATASIRIGAGVKEGGSLFLGTSVPVSVTAAGGKNGLVQLHSLRVTDPYADAWVSSGCALLSRLSSWEAFDCSSRATWDFMLHPQEADLGKKVTVSAVAETPVGGRTIVQRSVRIRSKVRLGISVAPGAKRAGDVVRVRGSVRKAHNREALTTRRALVQFRPAGAKGWRTVARARAGSNGKVSQTVRARRSGSYRWVMPAIGERYVRSVSPVRKVRVR